MKKESNSMNKPTLKISEIMSSLKDSSNHLAKVNILNFKSISLFKSLGYTITKKDKNFIIMNKETPSKSKKYLDIINKIERVRKKNNSNWMDILRIAFKHAPSETSKIMRNIYKEDKNISSLAKKLTR